MYIYIYDTFPKNVFRFQRHLNPFCNLPETSLRIVPSGITAYALLCAWVRDSGGDCMGRPSQFLQKTKGFVIMVISSDAWSDWELGEVVFVLTFFSKYINSLHDHCE